jgi:hypothetical protein
MTADPRPAGEACECGHALVRHGRWLAGRYDCCGCDTFRPAASGGATDGEREGACVICGYPRAEHEGDGEMVHDFVSAPVASQADGELREEIADLATELTSGRWDAQVGAAYLHADAVLALPAVRRLLADAAKVQRVEALADELALWRAMAERHANEWPADDHRRSTALGRAMGYQRLLKSGIRAIEDALDMWGEE